MSDGPGAAVHRAVVPPARSGRWLVLLLLPVLTWSGEVPTLGAVLASCQPLPILPDQDLAEGLLERPAAVVVPSPVPSRVAVLQALACATGSRFRLEGAGTVGRHLPPWPVTAARIHPSGLRERGLLPEVQRTLTPWWSPACGLDHDPQFGDWAASLPSRAQERLIEVLSLLDHPRTQLPVRAVAPGTPAPTTPVPGIATWPALAQAIGAPIASASGTWPPVPAVRTVAELVPALAQAGVQAAWVHGALCLVDTTERQDPAESVQVACLPLPARADPAQVLPPSTASGAFILRPGWIVAVAPPAVLVGLQERLDAFDRGDLP